MLSSPLPACLIFAHPIVLHDTCERTCSSPDYKIISSLSEWLQFNTCAMMGLARQFKSRRYTFSLCRVHAAIIAVVRLIYVTQSALLPPSLPIHLPSLSSSRAQSNSHSLHNFALFHSFNLFQSFSPKYPLCDHQAILAPYTHYKANKAFSIRVDLIHYCHH